MSTATKSRPRRDSSGLPIAVDFDSAKVLEDIRSQGKTVKGLSRELGKTESAVRKRLLQDKVSYYTLDEIACALGKHPMEYMFDTDAWQSG